MIKGYSGGCLCGDIRYTALDVRPIWYCHCEQCRRETGHHMAAAQVDLTNIDISGKPKWFYMAEKARFGFCERCGSTLFWRNENNAYLSITAGSLDDASGLEVKAHVFTAEKGGYYEIDQTLPRFDYFWDEGDL